MNRTALPARRRNITADAIWTAPDQSAHAFAVCVGCDAQGKPMEVFANHAKGAMAATLADACVLISIALQHGIPPEALAKSLGQVPSWPGSATVPASPIGTIMQAIAGMDMQSMPTTLPNEGLAFDDHHARRNAERAQHNGETGE